MIHWISTLCIFSDIIDLSTFCAVPTIPSKSFIKFSRLFSFNNGFQYKIVFKWIRLLALSFVCQALTCEIMPKHKDKWRNYALSLHKQGNGIFLCSPHRTCKLLWWRGVCVCEHWTNNDGNLVLLLHSKNCQFWTSNPFSLTGEKCLLL